MTAPTSRPHARRPPRRSTRLTGRRSAFLRPSIHPSGGVGPGHGPCGARPAAERRSDAWDGSLQRDGGDDRATGQAAVRPDRPRGSWRDPWRGFALGSDWRFRAATFTACPWGRAASRAKAAAIPADEVVRTGHFGRGPSASGSAEIVKCDQRIDDAAGAGGADPQGRSPRRRDRSAPPSGRSVVGVCRMPHAACRRSASARRPPARAAPAAQTETNVAAEPPRTARVRPAVTSPVRAAGTGPIRPGPPP